MVHPQTRHSEDNRDIFLSHRSSDKKLVRKLASDIEQSEYEGRHLLTWLDEAEIKPGQSITGMINGGLENSRFIGIVMTPDYFSSNSGWTDAEWHAALFADPDNRRGRIIPILASDCPYIPILLRHLLMLDFRGKNYDLALNQLLAILREEPLPRPSVFRGQLIDSVGRVTRSTLIAERAAPQADPDLINEQLFCNLLPVEKLPSYIYLATIAAGLYRQRMDGTQALPSKRDIIDAIHLGQRDTDQTEFTPAFRIFEDKILTFHDLESADSPFVSIIDEHEVEAIETIELLHDEDMRKIVLSLINMALDRHMHKIGLVVDRTKSRRFYFPPKDEKENVITWRPVKNIAKRNVAKPCLKDGVVQFWRHLGAYLKMVYLAHGIYLQIIPTWVFTEDGIQVKSGPTLGRLVIRWTGAERNLNLLYHIRFWTVVLQNRRGPMISIRAGDQFLELSSRPAFIQQSHGIKNDYRNLMAQLDSSISSIIEIEEETIDLDNVEDEVPEEISDEEEGYEEDDVLNEDEREIDIGKDTDDKG